MRYRVQATRSSSMDSYSSGYLRAPATRGLYSRGGMRMRAPSTRGMGMYGPATRGMEMHAPAISGMGMHAPVESAEKLVSAADSTLAPVFQPEPLMTDEQKYLNKSNIVLSSMVAENPNYRNQAGTLLYDFVCKNVGDSKAPKVTGMLIDLPLEDLKLVLQDFSLLHLRCE